MTTKNPDSSIPELMKRIRYSFRQCEFDEVQNTLMGMKDEIQNLAREGDYLKNELESLQRTHGFTELEKCSAEEKLGRSERRCEELDELIVQMREEIEKLRNENLDLKAKVIEADGVVKELNLKNLESVQTINELRAKKMESDKATEIYERNLSRVERTLAEIMNVNVDDLGSLANRTDKIAAAATDTEVEENNHIITSLEVPATSGAGNLAHSGTKENDASTVCTSKPASTSAVAESNAIVQDNEGQEDQGSHRSVIQSGGAKKTAASSAAGNVVITVSDSDDDDENKRDRRRESAINHCRKRKRNTCTTTPPAFHNVEYVDLEDGSSCSRVHT